jgi:hypothetical protein
MGVDDAKDSSPDVIIGHTIIGHIVIGDDDVLARGV